MLSSLTSPTRFVVRDSLSPEEFADAVFYLSGGEVRVAVVVDGRAFAERDALVAALRARMDTIVLDRVRPDPRAADIDAMRASMGSVGAVVGIGGGSVLDSAKALGMLAANGGSLGEYLGAAPARSIERKGPPVLLVPTTAGTGSEATKVGVYTADSGRKYTLASPFLQADAALLIGELAAGMPPSLAASTGFDALSHALESLWNKNATPLTVKAATEAAVAVLSAIGPAYEASAAKAAGTPLPDANARSRRMLEAAAMAGFAFSRTGTAMVHALSFVLSEEWHVPHGAACAFTLEDAFRLALAEPVVLGRLAHVAARAAASGALAGAEGLDPTRPAEAPKLSAALFAAVLRMKRNMRLPANFSDLGLSVDRADIRRLFDRAFDDPKMANTFPAVDRAAVLAFLEAKA